MKQPYAQRRGRRVCASTMAACLLLQGVMPAVAGVSQTPGLFVNPPLTNVMFTLDDSGSMVSDAIPDFIVDPSHTMTDMPNADGNSPGSNAIGSSADFFRARFPGMWQANTDYWGTRYYRADNAIARYMRSAAGNPLYYSPEVTYRPWPSATNDKLFNAEANPGAVNIDKSNPFNTAVTRNIKARVDVSAGILDDPARNFWPATYFVYKGATALPMATPNTALNTSGNFDKVEIKPGASFKRYERRTDCTGAVNSPTGCTYDQELQNFANWLQYYRSRALMAKGGIASAFALQQSNLRVGFGSINSPGTVRQGVADFAGTRRTSFYNDLYAVPVGGGTPLRRAMDDVGKYFQRSDAGNPWVDDTSNTSTVGTESSCRRSFHVLSTDGYWNGTGASGNAANNNDPYSGRTPKKPDAAGTDYAFSNSGSSADPLTGRFTIDPFADTVSNTLADVAAYYWKTDLRSTLDNEVASTPRDPAFWQHLTTYTIGFGITGSGTVARASDNSTVVPPSTPASSPLYAYRGQPWLDKQPVRDWLVENKVKLNWSTPVADAATTGDDLIHASMNGRGKYFPATDPRSLKVGLAAALAEAADNPASLANVVTKSPQVAAGSAVFQAIYNPAQWSGRFYAFPQAADGSVNTKAGSELWEASNKMPAPADRNIFTWNPTSKGKPFTWLGLSLAQQTDLGLDSTLLDWLRGSAANEAANGGTFRDRARYTPEGGVTGGVLGDVVNGSPVKGPSYGGGYNRLPTGTAGQGTYAAFRSVDNTGLDTMRNTIFLGANDGMLHAFNIGTDANRGVERFAYVPNAVFSVPRSPTGTEKKLQMLADPGYSHRFTVDGPPQIGDAFIGPSGAEAWKSVLVGSTGAGARAVFAMDVTNPAAGTGGFDTSKLMWEFSEADNADMGYLIGYPHVARMRNGSWVAIFGNGYDSTNGQAKLFVLDLQTGTVLWQQSVGAAGGNGLSQPNFIVNANREVTAIYAGDLKGNLWKFDVESADPTLWKVAFGSAPSYTPLYQGAATQPITVMPELVVHPNNGTMVNFGTGELFKTEDIAATGNVNLNTQALYGIWDKPAETTGFAGTGSLVQQGANTSLAAGADASARVSGTTSYTVDWATKRGWYMLLAAGNGERVNVNPTQINRVLLAVSNKPNADPCKNGGESRLFVLDAITGSAPTFAVLDSNGVNGVTDTDKGYNVKAFSFGVMSLPTVQTKGAAVADVVTLDRAGTRGQSGARAGGVVGDRGGVGDPGSGQTLTKEDCDNYAYAGGSNTSIAGFDVTSCPTSNARISWRQIK